MFLVLVITSVSSYYAVDTQEQHLLLTELLSAQKLYIERVVNQTVNVAQLGTIDQAKFQNQLTQNRKQLEGNIAEVDRLFSNARNRVYTLRDENIELKFRDEFARLFDDALAEAYASWQETKEQVAFLTTPENINQGAEYERVLAEFRENREELIVESDRIIELCRLEAEKKQVLSRNIQLGSILLSLMIFVYIIFLLRRDFYDPLVEIKDVFTQMSEGKLEQSFEREHEDEFKDLYQNFNQFIDNLNLIFSLEDKIIRENELEEVMDFIAREFTAFIPFEAVKIKYLNQEKNIIEKTFSQAENENSFECDQLLKLDDNLAEIKEITVQDNKLITPLRINETYLGSIEFIFAKEDIIADKHINFLELFKDKLSLAVYKSLLFQDLLTIVTDTLADMAEYKDPETGEHLKRMGYYSQIVAQELSTWDKYSDMIDDKFIEQIRIAAPMHDIGKVAIPDDILLKPGELTDDEFEVIKEHPAAGAEILAQLHEKFSHYNLDYFAMPYEIARGHHEKCDGTGYPQGLECDEISLVAKISALGDVFDALTSDRPYKEPFSLEKSYDIIKDMKGDHLDPDIVNAFFAVQEEIEEIHNQYNNN